MKDWRIKVDVAFAVAIALTTIVVICGCKTSGAAEAIQEPTTAPTMAEATECTTMPTKEETTAMEATVPQETELPVILYDVPLEEDLQIHIINLCEEKHIDPAIVFAMAWKESTYRPRAIGDNGKSFGLLQIQKKWHSKRMQKLGCTDLLDPYQNVAVAVDYLCELLNRYDGNIGKALTAYNRGHYSGTITNYAKKIMAKAEALAASKYEKEVSV